MSIEMEPIGFVSTDAGTIPRNWTVSDVEGTLVIIVSAGKDTGIDRSGS